MNNNEHIQSEAHEDERQGLTIRPASSTDTERPPSAQRGNQDADSGQPSSDEEETEQGIPDPAEQLQNFDWDALAQKYHDAIKQCEGNEAELMQEWGSLMSFFRIWAESGHAHETDRTFSRLSTRMAYVQNSEDNLEKTRAHYMNVVKAFESAMELLNGIQ